MTSRVVCLALHRPEQRARTAWGERMAKQFLRDWVMLNSSKAGTVITPQILVGAVVNVYLSFFNLTQCQFLSVC